MSVVQELLEGVPGEGFVDRRIYRDPEILELEKELIFARTWNYACTVHDLKKPGDFQTLTVGDEPVLVVRGNDNKIRAFYNACTHRGALLTGDPRGNYGQVFKCMYHAWAFNLLGELIGVPYVEGYGEDFDQSQYGLVPVHCDTFYDLVFVAINPRIPSLSDYLGEMADHLGPYVDGIEPIGRNSWIYEGNWKLWHENFRDNYHPEFTHRLIHDLSPNYADAGGNWGLTGGHSVLQWAGPRAPSPDNYLRGLARHAGVTIDPVRTPMVGEDREGAPDEVLAVFPNADFQPRATIPGRGLKAGFIQTVVPLGVDRARVEMTVYSSVDDDESTRRAHLEGVADTQGSWGKISCDDTEAAYRVQLGVLGHGTRFNIFTRGTAELADGKDAQSRDEYSQRAFYRAYYDYLGALRQ